VGGSTKADTLASSSNQCSGTLDAVSLVVDWRFAKHVDVYAGVMYSQVNGGLENNFIVNNVGTTVQARGGKVIFHGGGGMQAKLSHVITVPLFILFCTGSTSAQAPAPAAVGSIPGSFSVSLSGSSTYSIPIKIPPGTAGTEPKIALVYDSQALGGALGAGWSISGLSVITRGPKDIFTDGFSAGIKLEDGDALYLDGQRIVPISQSGSGPTRTIEYRKAAGNSNGNRVKSARRTLRSFAIAWSARVTKKSSS
jgi:hypothetical protein